MWNIQGIYKLYGSFQTFSATVETVVVSGYQYIETGVMDGRQIFIGSAESRVAFVWLSSEGYFQVSYRKVGSAYFCFDIFKIGRIIVSSFCGACSIYLSLMLHEVSYEKKRKSICFQAVCCRYLYGNGILLCFADAGELCNQKKGY